MKITVDNQPFDETIEHFAFGDDKETIDDTAELKKLRLFKNLKSATFAGNNLDDVGLDYVCDVPTIDNLCLQETKVTDQGLASLAKLPRLMYLRLKDNPQLTDDCVPHLVRLPQLVDLQIHETSITEEGLRQLATAQTLTGICIDVWNDNYSFDGLAEVSAQMPNCTILAKGRGEFHRGKFSGRWEKP